MSLRRLTWPGALAVLALAGGLAGEAAADTRAPDHLVVRSAQSMGTRVTLTLWTDDEAGAARAAAAAFEEFARIDSLMTTWRGDSAIMRINAAAGERAVPVDDEIMTVIRKAQEVSRASGGAFDITVGAFWGLWKFDEDRDGTIPDAEAVRQRRALVGYRDVQVNAGKKTVKLRRKGMRINLGGIAKGYAVDRAVALVRGRGFDNFILQAGGDLYVSGQRGDRPWRVGIRDPRGERDATFAVAAIKDRTFSTSGDYERSILENGVRYHHILDPATGHPARRSRSVTVLAADALTADAWSTALFVMGVARGMPLVEKMRDLEAVFVDAENKVHISSGLQGKVWVHRPPTPGI